MTSRELVPLFLLQVALSFGAWSAIGAWLVLPYLRTQPTNRALFLLLLPQAFRHIGATLLVPGIADPQLPRGFALPTAIGDIITQVLALVCLACLAQGRRYSIPLVWIANTWGLFDLLLNVSRAVRTGAIAYLHAAWVVPTFIVPLMVVSHLFIFWVLLRRRPGGETPPHSA